MQSVIEEKYKNKLILYINERAFYTLIDKLTGFQHGGQVFTHMLIPELRSTLLEIGVR